MNKKYKTIKTILLIVMAVAILFSLVGLVLVLMDFSKGNGSFPLLPCIAAAVTIILAGFAIVFINQLLIDPVIVAAETGFSGKTFRAAFSRAKSTFFCKFHKSSAFLLSIC